MCIYIPTYTFQSDRNSAKRFVLMIIFWAFLLSSITFFLHQTQGQI